MDCTPEYVKMCDCPEIQGQRPRDLEGEYVSLRQEYAERWGGDMRANQAGDWLPHKDEWYIWAPMQHQLQEMVIACGTWEDLLVEFSSWYSPWGVLHNEYASSFKSFEQAWLAFVMAEKYGKTWNGEAWT